MLNLLRLFRSVLGYVLAALLIKGPQPVSAFEFAHWLFVCIVTPADVTFHNLGILTTLHVVIMFSAIRAVLVASGYLAPIAKMFAHAVDWVLIAVSYFTTLEAVRNHDLADHFSHLVGLRINVWQTTTAIWLVFTILGLAMKFILKSSTKNP